MVEKKEEELRRNYRTAVTLTLEEHAAVKSLAREDERSISFTIGKLLRRERDRRKKLREIEAVEALSAGD